MEQVFRHICLAVCLVSFVELNLRQVAVHGVVRGTRPECQRALDVVFLLQVGPSSTPYDVTGQIRNPTLDCIANVTTKLRPSTSGTHIGVMYFATRTTTAQFLAHGLWNVENMFSYDRGLGEKRDLAGALRDARAKIFNNKDGDRSAVPDVLVVITHSVSDDVAASRQAAEELKSDGIRIITVGIGGEVDEMKRELKSIASYPDETDMLISVHGYKHLVNPLVSAICKREFEEQEGAIRLADEHLASGRLEVFVRGEWATVCSTSWSAVNTDVACRQLGFLSGSNWYSVSEDTYSPRTGFGNVTCTGHELLLMDCPYDPVFHVDPVCDHARDVFLTCFCANCRDYRIRDNVRLVGGGFTYGRLEVFSPRDKWGGICRDSWDAAATRVACRQLGFLDGAGTYDTNNNGGDPSIPRAVHAVSCAGNETSLFDCSYQTMPGHKLCSGAAKVLCQCSQCIDRHLLHSPRERLVTTGSKVQFEWRLTNSSGGDFEFWFLSRKNRRLVLRRRGNQVTFENTALGHRVQLIGDNEMVLGFILTNASRDDMGTYVLHVPRMRLFNSEAILFLTDFAVVPDPVVHCELGESVKLIWDFTALRQLTDITHEILLTTPSTGRVPLSYYYSHWLTDNPGRHDVRMSTDRLYMMIIIHRVTAKDAGKYAVELNLTSSIHLFANTTLKFTSSLVLPPDPAFVALIVLGSSLGAGLLGTVTVVVGLLLMLRKVYPRHCREEKSSRSPRHERNHARQRGVEAESSSRYRRQQAPPNDEDLRQDFNETRQHDQVPTSRVQVIDIIEPERQHSPELPPKLPPLPRAPIPVPSRRQRFTSSNTRADYTNNF